MLEHQTLYHGVPYIVYMKEKNYKYFHIKIGGITYRDINTDLMKNKKYVIYPILKDLFKSEPKIKSMKLAELRNVFYDLFYMDLYKLNNST